MMAAEQKAGILVEALPYIKKYAGKTVVIKYGGSVASALGKSGAADLVLLKKVGINPVVVHGGKHLLDREMDKAGIKPRFVKGLRVTGANAIPIAEKAFSMVGSMIVKAVGSAGGKAVAVPGTKLISAEQESKALGFVGKVTKVSTGKINELVEKGQIPVISPLGKGSSGKTYNINADSAAVAVAAALKAEKITIATNVAGVLEKGKLVSHLSIGNAREKIRAGVINGGMIPKVEACVKAVQSGIPKAHLVDGGLSHSLLLEIFTDKGVGTEVVKDGI